MSNEMPSQKVQSTEAKVKPEIVESGWIRMMEE